MSKVTHALAAAIGFAAGVLAIALAYTNSYVFRTCHNTHEHGGFTCSECGSTTDYKPTTPFRACPMCGATVIRKEWI